MKVSHEDGLMAGNMMITAKNIIMKERIQINSVASEIVFKPLHPDTGALLHEEFVIASNSTSKMSLMECGHPENFLFSWFRRVPRR